MKRRNIRMKNRGEIIRKIVHVFHQADDKLSASAIMIRDTIDRSNFPSWLKITLTWIVAKVFKKRGVYSFLRSYLSIGAAILLTRPGLWEAIVKFCIGEEHWAGKALLAVIDFLAGTVDYVVFWGLSAVAVVVILCHTFILYQQNKTKRLLAELLEELAFNPDKGWFDQQCRDTIKVMGNRYSSEINFKNPNLSNVYKALITPDYWDWQFKKALQNYVKECRHLFNGLSDKEQHQQKEIALKISEIIDVYNAQRYEQYGAMFRHAQDILDKFRDIHYRDRQEVSEYKYRQLADAFSQLLDYESICQFTSAPVLYIKGDAGTGKSHLLADIVSTRIERKLKSLMVLGLSFSRTDTDVKERILDILGVKCPWNDFLRYLDKMGEIEHQRILITIDGVNEGPGFQLWTPETLRSIETDILQYRHLGLVVTARTFAQKNLLDDVANDRAIITMEGFRGMEDESIAYLTGKYGITLPNISRYKNEFSNPLFLKLYCEAYSLAQHSAPDSFLDVVKNYIKKVNEKQAAKYGYQPEMYHNVQQVTVVMTDLYVQQQTSPMTKFQKLESLLTAVRNAIPNIQAENFVQDLVSEGVLMTYVNKHGEVLIDFNFDLVGDYLCAAKLIEVNWQNYIGRIYDQGIYEATSVLLPLMKGVEIFDHNATNIDNDFRENLFIESLKNRFSLSADALKEIEKIKHVDVDQFFEILPIIAIRPESRDIIKTFNNEMKAMTMVERDRIWSMHFTVNCNDPSRTELVEMSKWASSISRNSAGMMSDDIAYQMACVMCWGFSSPYRLLRDVATKAAVNILQDKPEVVISLVDVFDDVNDPYIQQRLYAVVHGCVMKGYCCQSERLGHLVYEKVFNVASLRTDILLRDYARCVIDFIGQHVTLESIDLTKIEPPYHVSFSFDDCPDRATVEGKYRLDSTMGFSDDVIYTQNKILGSMETEYSKGVGDYGDFGRYTFESALRRWDDCEGYSASLLRNYALQLIFDKYQFDAKVYVHHDKYFMASRGNRPVMERFGKKYQWMAMYEILGLMQDNYAMESGVSNHKKVQCLGTWDPHVRDIDTTNAFVNEYDENKLRPRGESLEWLHINTMPFTVKHEKQWLSSKEGMSVHVVKTSIERVDEKGDAWLVLYGYNTMLPETMSLTVDEDEIGLWEFVQAYTVPKDQRKGLVKAMKNKGNQGRSMPEYRNSLYELFYKDYYSTASYREFTQRNELDEWSEFEESQSVFQISYRPYTSEGELSVNRLSKQLFELMNLKDGEKVGEYVDETGRVVAFDPSINHTNEGQLLVRKKELLEALNQNELSMVWPVLLEKQRGTKAIGLQIGGVAYMTEKGKIKVNLKLYKPRRVNEKARYRKIMLGYYSQLIWNTVIFNETGRRAARARIDQAKSFMMTRKRI